MYALARQDVGKTDPRRQHLHPYLACFWGGEFFFDNGDHFRAAVVSNDNSFVAHISDTVFRSYNSARLSIQIPKSPVPATSFPRGTRMRVRLSKRIAARRASLANAAVSDYNASRLTCSHSESTTINRVAFSFELLLSCRQTGH
jgi:hypothetical protein